MNSEKTFICLESNCTNCRIIFEAEHFLQHKFHNYTTLKEYQIRILNSKVIKE